MTPNVRGGSFAERATLAAALAWVEAHTCVLPSEDISVLDAAGRTLASPLHPPAWPPTDRAAVDGYAVSAAETDGATDYSPLPLGFAIPVTLGDVLPPGTDAVLAYPSVSRRGSAVDAVVAAAPGAGVERRGSEATLLHPGPLRHDAVALLTLMGVARIAVVRRPRVALVVAGAKAGPDVLTPLVGSLVARDGGIPEVRETLAAAPDGPADLVLLVGRSGCGLDDDMPHRIAAAGGVLALHGIAFRPGDSAGLGWLHGAPAVLIPGSPAAAASVYEMLAGPAVRRLGGRTDALPWVEKDAVLDRKVTSIVGCTDMVQVRLAGGRATPLGPADTAGLGRVVLSDGWLLVPDGSEGYRAGAAVTVCCPLPLMQASNHRGTHPATGTEP